ncbi:uncharacterized protein E0L32_001113 [Thyridium curvatum]|uniref:3-phytase n=1 Tax=Thyridium curvatum TaxID=1093900 RepID=A0A507AL41_9PEZI|nr:uncharacterized protein E0L32_001113 [Thyridium curvatum]TPX11295.1 hypothetical protein E0L32_001113 [Thyridium curvatum]
MIASSLVALLALGLSHARAAVEVSANVTVFPGKVKSDSTAILYADQQPLVLGNDGTAHGGGFHVYDLGARSEVTSVYTGRTKLVTTVQNVNGRHWAVTIAQPDSVMRVFELPAVRRVESADFKSLGDWSALCGWKSKTGNQYVYLFGKKEAVEFLVQPAGEDVKLVEVQRFPVPFEASGCAASRSQSRMYVSADDDKTVYAFSLAETTSTPKIVEAGKAASDVTGLAVYVGLEQDYLFVAQESTIGVYDKSFKLAGTIGLKGLAGIKAKGLNIYQGAASPYAAGAVTFAFKSKSGTGAGFVELENVLKSLGISKNTAFDPRRVGSCGRKSPLCDACSGNGFCGNGTAPSCSCFSGFAGGKCTDITCTDNCSGHGKCIGANVCKCEAGWGGLFCSFLDIEPTYETEASGDDGDDPAIWINPVDRAQSRIITTTKSDQGAGLGLFDLTGKLLQHLPASKPNNIDVIYSFQAGGRKIDLAFAGCRGDNTLCLFEIAPNGTLSAIAGGIQPVVAGFTVYGSCTYRSRKSGKQYLFVNEKSSRYLQYELSATAAGELQTTLLRDFMAGSGGQVEGCVADDANGWLFLGEEPSALWRYGAEPDRGRAEGVAIARVGDGKLHGDVEGVTLVEGGTADAGLIIVSNQGVSAYNIYRRAAPHEYVATFTVVRTADGRVDAVSNTDGVAAVGAALGGDFPQGLVVVHDDANELPDGTTSEEASFKLVSLGKILGAEQLKALNLSGEVDAAWDPRKGL